MPRSLWTCSRCGRTRVDFKHGQVVEAVSDDGTVEARLVFMCPRGCRADDNPTWLDLTLGQLFKRLIPRR